MPDRLRAAGFNAVGVLGSERYDELVPAAWRSGLLLPQARSVLVLATGGRAFFESFAHARAAGEPRFARDAENPLDSFAQDQLDRGAAEWSGRGFATRSISYWEQCGEPPVFADFVALGRASGLGTASRLGVLLHPEFGPWFALRAIWLTTRNLEATPAAADEGPCHGCAGPCQNTCPVSAPAPAGFDAFRCRQERERSPGCRNRCDARHACVIGQEYAYTTDAESHHMGAAFDLPVRRRST